MKPIAAAGRSTRQRPHSAGHRGDASQYRRGQVGTRPERRTRRQVDWRLRGCEPHSRNAARPSWSRGSTEHRRQEAGGGRSTACSRASSRQLSDDELRQLGQVMRNLAAEGEHPTGLAAIRLMLLSGFRRMEVLGLERSWVSRRDHCVRFPDTKSGAQIRVIGEAAMACVEAAPGREGSPLFVPGRLGRRAFRRCRAGSRPSLCKSKTQGRDAPCSSPHVCQRSG